MFIRSKMTVAEIQEFKRLRKAIGLSQNDVEKESGISRSVIANMESAKQSRPSGINAARIRDLIAKMRQDLAEKSGMATPPAIIAPKARETFVATTFCHHCDGYVPGPEQCAHCLYCGEPFNPGLVPPTVTPDVLPGKRK